MSTLVAGSSAINLWNLNNYVFDAWLRMYQNSSLTITQHPVQTGAAITDHSYVNPRRFQFEVGMSDIATSIIPGQWSGSGSRSVNAYNLLEYWQSTRELLTLRTKYGEYSNILIEGIDVGDDWTTVNALKATITLREIFLVNATAVQVSGLPQITDSTNRGDVNGNVPDDSAMKMWLQNIGVPNGVLIPGKS